MSPLDIKNELYYLRQSVSSINSTIYLLEKDLQEVQDKCKHDYVFSCYTRNDSAYDCRKCGKTEYR